MVSLRQMVFAGAAALRRQVLHSGGLLGVVRSVFLNFLSTRDRVLTVTSRQKKVGCHENFAYSATVTLRF